MTPERWRRVGELFHEALEIPLDERAVWVETACHGDEAVRRELMSLLESDREAGGGFVQNQVKTAVTSFAEGTPVRRAGPYRLARKLGRGGMGTVYLGERDDEEYQTQVAVKLVRPGMDTEFCLHRFRRERQILARLQHPHIARLLDGGATEDGLPYIVMEYIDGSRINEYCAQHSLPIREILRLFLDVCAAVEHAHQNFVVHRDLKPGNIMVDRSGCVKLLDFGICKVLHAGVGPDATMENSVQMLTPDYASPEQIRGDAITVASDVYSLGAVLYELLTGVKPHCFGSFTPQELERAICAVEVAPPSIAAKDRFQGRRLKGDLDSILVLALDKDPARRYASVERFAEDLRRHLRHEPVEARPNTLVYRVRKFVRRERSLVLAGSAVILSLSAGMAVSVREMRAARASLLQVRSLANTFVFDVHDAVRDLPGSTRARRLIVSTGLRYLDQLARQSSRDRQLRAEVAAAYQRIGDVQGDVMSANLGDTRGALASYGKAMALVQAALAEDSVDQKAQLDQMRLLQKIAGIYSYTEDSAQALVNYREAERVGELCRSQDFGNQEVLRRLASIQIGAAEVLRLRGDYQAAREENAKALKLLLEAAAARPSDRSLESALAEAYTAVGSSEVRLGRLREGLEDYRQAQARMERLCQIDPANAAFQRILMQAYSRIGDVLGNPNLPNLEDTEGATLAYHRMLDLGRRLHEADPADQKALSDYAIAMTRVAAVSRAERVELLRESVRLLQEVGRINRQNVMNEWDLAHGYGLLGDALIASGDRAGALRAYRESLTRAEALMAAGMSAPAPTLIAVCQKLAEDAANQGDRTTAMKYALRAMEVSDPQGAYA